MSGKEALDFSWLPGYREMMACREDSAAENAEGSGADTAGEAVEETMEETMEKSMEDARDRLLRKAERMDEGDRTEEESRASSGMEECGGLLPPERLQADEAQYWKSYEYMNFLLPAIAREIWVVTDAVLDRYEFEGSAIYAEYPDKNTVRRIADLVYEKLSYRETQPQEAGEDGTKRDTPLYELILVMVCWNMDYRRGRYYRRKQVFSESQDKIG